MKISAKEVPVFTFSFSLPGGRLAPPPCSRQLRHW